MKNPRVSRRKEILKLRAEINAKETTEALFLSLSHHDPTKVTSKSNVWYI